MICFALCVCVCLCVRPGSEMESNTDVLVADIVQEQLKHQVHQ